MELLFCIRVNNWKRKQLYTNYLYKQERESP